MLLPDRNTMLMAAVVAVVVYGGGVGTGYYLWGNPKPTIVTVPQKAVETPTGVKAAAEATGIKLSDKQAHEAAVAITEAKDEPPKYTVATTTEKAPQAIEQERVKNKADLAIVTNPKEPEKTFDFSDYKAEQPISLNQYNIKAYKERLRGVTYYPKTLKDWSPAVIEADYSWKITKNGQYAGLAISHNFDNHRTYAGVRVAF